MAPPRTLLLFLPMALAAALPPVAAQTPYFTLEIEEVAATNAPAIHSTAVAQHNGLSLFVTGRTDGLHLLFGGQAFPADMQNNHVFVYDAEVDQSWAASLNELPDAVADPLRVTNGQYWQDGETLFVLGGYGYSNAAAQKLTFGILTAIDVPGIIAAVQNATPLAPHIRQMASDERLKVAGGHLIRFDGRYHLVGGNRFDGEYLGGFTQTYTEAVRTFRITDDGSTLGLSNYGETVDAANLHRRDLNVSPVILDDGSEGFALFGGVFQVDANLPFRNPVYFDGASMVVDASFAAQFGHYTSPVIPLYDADPGAESMHSVFVGGMNQFYYDEASGQVIEDPLVPFVDDVTMITRTADGTTTETILPITLPALMGTNASLLLNPSLPAYDNGVIRLRDVTGRTLIGHILGGIEADQPNAGWMGGTTHAGNRLLEVYVTVIPVTNETATPATFSVSPPSPNPFRSATSISFRLDSPQHLRVDVVDALGRRVATLRDEYLGSGMHSVSFRPDGIAGGVYTVRLCGEAGSVSTRLFYVR